MIYHFCLLLGFDPRATFHFVRGIGYYLRDLIKIKSQRRGDRAFTFHYHPILNDRFLSSGVMSGHYFHMDLLVARKIHENEPRRHVDIGSRTDGFVAHVAVFREIELLDIRAQESKTPNIKFRQADLMNLPADMENYCDSLSSLHAVEHFGLGRYGDPVQYDGYKSAIDNMYRILEPGGRFYFAVPIGRQRIEFNAHRVFAVRFLQELFADRFRIDAFHYVNDAGDLFEDAALEGSGPEGPGADENFGCRYGCGIFELIKLS